MPHPEPVMPTQCAQQRCGVGPCRLLMPIAMGLAMMLCAADSQAQRAIIYKCTQPDGRTEYSNVPCGPYEQPDYITGDSFSVIVRDRVGPQPAISPPLSPRAIGRQRSMEQEARQHAPPP